MQGAVLCRAPEYVDGILEVSRSLMWGRAVVEESAGELATGSWETLECRQLRVLSLVAELPPDSWAKRNQDHALLNGLQPLPQMDPSDALQHKEAARSLTSFAASWGSPKKTGSTGSRRESGHGAADEQMSKSLDAARALLPEATSLANCVEAAVRAAMEDGSCWGNAPSACETFANLCSFTAVEVALMVLRTGAEAAESVTSKLEEISTHLGSLLQCFRHGFKPAPRVGEEKSDLQPFMLAGFGARCLAKLSHCFLVLIVVVLWLSTALPKSSKKAKAGDALHQSRIALRETFQVLQRSITELQTELQSAAKMDCPTAAPSIFRDVFKGNEMKEFQSVQVIPKLMEAHLSQLKMLADVMGQRLALLKSRGTFKP
eukprot:symbB.v1.2.027752.t1/scaffold2871.1/size68436/4